MRIVCIVQARMGSSRLPGKVMKKICGKTVLEHCINRLKKVKSIDDVIVATTDKDIDSEIVAEARRIGVKYFVGSENDVLLRYYLAAKENDADVIVRVTSDCPLIDFEVTEKVIRLYLNNDYDYVNNTYKQSYPRGLDTEVFSFKLLEKACKEADEEIYREHVTTFFWKNPHRFKIGCLVNEKEYSHLRWTVDTVEDLKLIKNIFESLYKQNEFFKMDDIIQLHEENPDLWKVNQMIKQKELKEK